MSVCKLLSLYWQILSNDPGNLVQPEIQYAYKKYLIKQELIFVADSVDQTRAINKKKTVQGLKKTCPTSRKS